MTAVLSNGKDERTGADSTFMSVDSPQVLAMTDLDTAGLTSVTFPQGISISGGGTTGDSTRQPDEYFAYCKQQVHPPDMAGVQSNGEWLGPAHDTAADAAADCQTHGDLGARVYKGVGTTIVGPMANPA